MPPQALSPSRPVSSMRALRQSRDGSMATTFALVLLPALVMVGAGVDVVRAYTARLRFETAFDNAAAVLQSSAATDSAAVLQARMQAYLDLAVPSSAQGGHVTVRMSDPLQPVVMVTASAAVPTTLMQLAGVPSFSLQAAAQVVRQNPPGRTATSGHGDDSGRRQDDNQWQHGYRRGIWLREDLHN